MSDLVSSGIPNLGESSFLGSSVAGQVGPGRAETDHAEEVGR